MKPFQSTQTIGEIGGFPISLHRFDEKVNLIFHGKREHKANVSDSPTGTISSVEHALESMEERLNESEADLKLAHKQTEDLTKQLDHPFEHEEKLNAASRRQQEIVAALDITKNQASAKVTDEQESNVETVDTAGRESVPSKRSRVAAVKV